MEMTPFPMPFVRPCPGFSLLSPGLLLPVGRPFASALFIGATLKNFSHFFGAHILLVCLAEFTLAWDRINLCSNLHQSLF
jgi:hypothetical protein